MRRAVPPWGLRPQAPPLRTQLLAAFAVVAVVALVAGGAAVVWLTLGYRAQVTSQRLRDAAVSAEIAGGMLERQGASPESIATSVAAQVPLTATRVLVLDPSCLTLADASGAGTTP